MVQHILNDVDPGMLKTTLVNFFIPAISLEGDETTTDSRRGEEKVKNRR